MWHNQLNCYHYDTRFWGGGGNSSARRHFGDETTWRGSLPVTSSFCNVLSISVNKDFQNTRGTQGHVTGRENRQFRDYG